MYQRMTPLRRFFSISVLSWRVAPEMESARTAEQIVRPVKEERVSSDLNGAPNNFLAA